MQIPPILQIHNITFSEFLQHIFIAKLRHISTKMLIKLKVIPSHLKISLLILLR